MCIRVNGTACTFGGIANTGTVAAGTWNGTAHTVQYGGTGLATTTAKAVMITHDSGGTNALASVAMSANGQLLIGGTSGPAVGTI